MSAGQNREPLIPVRYSTELTSLPRDKHEVSRIGRQDAAAEGGFLVPGRR